jgi:antitoxin component HigA of HigAB toxin-antitoxin module
MDSFGLVGYMDNKTQIVVKDILHEEEYEQALTRLNDLLDEIGTNEQHPLYHLLDTLGTIIEAYEIEHYPIPNCHGNDVLNFQNLGYNEL